MGEIRELDRALPRRRFSTDEFLRMIEAGVFRPDERVELIEGELLTMPPIGDPHANLVSSLASLLVLATDPCRVRVQQPLRLSASSRPEPDITVLAQPVLFPPPRWSPTPADVVLLVEVADTNIGYDERKLRSYAEAGVPQVLLVDVQGGCLRLLSEPGAQGFGRESEWRAPQVIQLDDPPLKLELDRLFPAS
jgi:hypothetical protein